MQIEIIYTKEIKRNIYMNISIEYYLFSIQTNIYIFAS